MNFSDSNNNINEKINGALSFPLIPPQSFSLQSSNVDKLDSVRLEKNLFTEKR